MEKLLNFLDGYVLERSFYWKVRVIYSTSFCEIKWKQGNKDQWQIKPELAKDWTIASTKEVISILNDNKVDLAGFETQLTESLLQQVVYANTFMERGLSLFGEDKVQEAIRLHKEFLNNLKEAITACLGNNPDKHTKEESSPTESSKPASQERKFENRSFLRLLDDSSQYKKNPNS